MRNIHCHLVILYTGIKKWLGHFVREITKSSKLKWNIRMQIIITNEFKIQCIKLTNCLEVCVIYECYIRNQLFKLIFILTKKLLFTQLLY